MKKIVAVYPELRFSSEFKVFFARVSMIRLVIMVFLLGLVLLQFFGFFNREMQFQLHQEIQHTLFFIVGFSLGIFYIFYVHKLYYSIYFFIFQFVADLFLSIWWIILTGVVFSEFYFLCIILIFFYGRIIGFKWSLFASFLISLTTFVISCIQFYYPYLWGEYNINGSDIAYNYFLFNIALVLVLILIRVSKYEEGRLTNKILEKENALYNAEMLKFRVFDWLESGLMLVNTQGKITTINERALEWIPGGSRNSVLGMPFMDFYPEFISSWDNRELVPNSQRNMVQSEDRGVVFGFKMTELPEAQGWMFLFSDITEVKRLEKQVREMEKLAVVGELAAGLAHEMKNPLAGIKASLQLLLSEDPGSDFFKRLSKVVIRDIDRLDILLKEFLVFARPRPAQREALDLEDEISHLLTPLIASYPQIQFDVGVSEEPLHFDKNQLHQILMNILINACQALEGRTDPRIRIFEVRERGERGERGLVVADNGPGIPPEMAEKCFEPFITSKPVGSGLGLSIAQRLAAQNNGRIELFTSSEGGTRFTLVVDGDPAQENISNS